MEFWDFFWVIVASFLLFAYLMLLFSIFADIFRDRELGGWGKALWSLFLVFMPWLGALVYLVVRGNTMTDRSIGRARDVQAPEADYIRSLASSPTAASPAEQVAEAKVLLDSGAITAEEFTAMTGKALA